MIVTKCSADQLPISTQIRKRPRGDGPGKQKDWPEKRHKDSSTNSSPVKNIPVRFPTLDEVRRLDGRQKSVCKPNFIFGFQTISGN